MAMVTVTVMVMVTVTKFLYLDAQRYAKTCFTPKSRISSRYIHTHMGMRAYVNIVHVRVCLCVLVYTYKYGHARAHTWILYMFVCSCACVSVCVSIGRCWTNRQNIHTYTRTYIHTMGFLAYMTIFIHTHIKIYIHHTYAYKRLHTYVCVQGLRQPYLSSWCTCKYIIYIYTHIREINMNFSAASGLSDTHIYTYKCTCICIRIYTCSRLRDEHEFLGSIWLVRHIWMT